MIRPSLLILLLLLPAVHAVGFMNLPQQREIVFDPGAEVSIPLYVINGNSISVSTSSFSAAHPETIGTPNDDNIMEYVTLEDAAPRTGPRPVTLKFHFPQQLRPGFYEVDVYATDYPTNTEGATVSAVATTRVRFTVRVLSPDKLAEITGLYVPPIAEGLPANATTYVVSRSQLPIEQVQAEVQLYKDDAILLTGKSAVKPLASAESIELPVILKTEELTGGEYLVNTTVTYDGKSTTFGPELLKIGTLHVGVPDYTRTFTHNVTNRFLFNISNQWNKELQDVYATVSIGGQTKKTASQNIAPFGKTEYELYFDRDEALVPGTLQANVTITFKDYDPKSKSYVNKQETISLPVDVVVPPAPVKTTIDMKQVIVYGVIGLLIILLAIAIVLLLRKPKEAQPAVSQAPPKQ